MNAYNESIPNGLLDKVSWGDAKATFELAEILFQQKRYNFAKTLFGYAKNQGILGAEKRIGEIGVLLYTIPTKEGETCNE